MLKQNTTSNQYYTTNNFNVLSTTNSMGCEIIPASQVEFSGYRKLLKKLDLKVLKLPVRMRGLTSSGTRGQCYNNVDNLVEVFGGRSVVGWAVKYESKQKNSSKNSQTYHAIKLFGHAVWMTKEGNLVDVTAKSWNWYAAPKNLSSNIWGAINENGKVYHQYIPLKVGALSDHYACNMLLLTAATDTHGRLVKEWEPTIFHKGPEMNPITLTWKQVTSAIIDSKIVFRENVLEEFGSLEEFNKHRRQIGAFHEASLVSGKTLEEIRVSKHIQ